MQRKGFTLGEILIVLLLIGILSVLSIQTVKTQQQKFTFTCYHLYRDLKIAVGHMAAQTYGGSLKSFSAIASLKPLITRNVWQTDLRVNLMQTC